MIDVLLTHSYFISFDPKQKKAMMPYPPLGTLYAAGHLEHSGIPVALFDPMLEESEEEIRFSLEAYHPKIVAIYDDDFNYLNKMCLLRMREAAFRMTAIAKEYGSLVIVHGSDATDHAEAYLHRGADVVIIGEGEQTLTEICQDVLYKDQRDFSSIAGTACMQNGSVVRAARRPLIKNLDELPFPSWHLINGEQYKQAWEKKHDYFSLNIVTTRGCPYHCNWCAKPIYGQIYNSRSPENVIQEIKLLQLTLQPDHIWFADDIFGLKPGWMKKFSELIVQEKISIRFKIQSRADLLLDPEIVNALAKAGCEEIWVGAESGSQKILDSMEKGTTVSQIYSVRRLLQRHHIKAAFFLQFGYLGEGKKEIDATIKMVKDLMPDDIGISISYPLPGTKFYDTVRMEMKEKQNWIDSDDLALMFHGTFSAAYYKRLHRYVHKLYRFQKGLRIIREAFTVKLSLSWSQLRTIILAVYYAPLILIDRLKLLYLEHT